MKKIGCFLCKSKNKKIIVSQSFNDKYLELVNPKYNDITRKWVCCENCGFIYHYPMLDKDDMQTLYAKFRDSSFRGESANEYFDRIVKIPPIESENHYKVSWLISNIKELSTKNSKILDVGCGGGVFLHTLKSRIQNCTIFGLEPTNVFSELASSKLSCQVFNGNLDGIVFSGEYDLITCNHVLEHADDPILFFNNLYSNVRDEGYLYIEVPSIEDFNDKSLSLDNDRFLMQHLWYFSPEILEKIALDSGFKLHKIETRKTVIGKNDLVAIFRK